MMTIQIYRLLIMITYNKGALSMQEFRRHETVGKNALDNYVVLSDHEIFNNKDYDYSTICRINPFDIVVSVNRSRVGKSELIFTFRGNDSVTVSIGWSQKIETFFFKRYREGNVNANDTKREFNLFMKEYLKFD